MSLPTTSASALHDNADRGDGAPESLIHNPVLKLIHISKGSIGGHARSLAKRHFSQRRSTPDVIDEAKLIFGHNVNDNAGCFRISVQGKIIDRNGTKPICKVENDKRFIRATLTVSSAIV